MLEYVIGDYFEVPIQVQDPSTAEASDADALPTYRVYKAGTDTVVATGTAAKRDDANTVGYYIARAELTSPTYATGDYTVRVSAIVGGVAGANPVGSFRVVNTLGGTGLGSRTITVTVTNDLSELLEDVSVTIANQTETTTIAGPLRTNENGICIFYLNDSTNYRAIPKSGNNRTGGATNFTVSGATSVSCVMEESANVHADICAIYAQILEPDALDDTPVEDALITFELEDPPGGTDDGVIIGAESGSVVTDSNGEVTLYLRWSSVVGNYRIKCDAIDFDYVVVVADKATDYLIDLVRV
jgi:hypothetical protein